MKGTVNVISSDSAIKKGHDVHTMEYFQTTSVSEFNEFEPRLKSAKTGFN